MIKFFLLPVIASVCFVSGNAQFFDSLSVSAGSLGTAASKSYQPVWLTSNRFGVITDKQADLSTNLSIVNKHALTIKEYLDDDLLVHQNNIVFSYGLNLVNNNHFKNSIAEQAFAKLEYKNWSLRVGRFEETLGDVDRNLSSGSLGVSGNALPIPKIGIAVTDYTLVPFTNGWLQFKGSFAHGWFGNNRYMKNAYYHEKTLYVRIGKGRFKVYGGLQHYAEWGGNRGNKQLERSWKGFWDVVLVKQADDGSVGTAVNGIQPSRAGDQRGLIEAGADLETDKLIFHGYAQVPFESGEEIDTRNRSVLAGLAVSFKESWFNKIVAEFLYTKNMNEFVSVKQRNSYYNNGYYRTGWEYENRIIGTPIFMNRTTASHYFSDIQPFDWNAAENTIPGNLNIVDNRISGIHVGAQYTVNPVIAARTLFTYTRNYGTWYASEFEPVKVQFYTLQEFNVAPVNSRWAFKLAAAVDFGQLGANAGAMLGCSYKIF